MILWSAWVFALTGCSVSDPDDTAASADPLVPIQTSTADGSEASDPQLVGEQADLASLRARLRTDVERAEIWDCIASRHDHDIGFAFDNDSGEFLAWPADAPSIATDFDWSVTDGQSILLDDARRGQQTDIRQIEFDGDDRWTGFSARDGALDCIRVEQRDDPSSHEDSPDIATTLSARSNPDGNALDYWRCSSSREDLPVGYLFVAGGHGVHAHLSRQDDRRFAIDWRVANDLLRVSFGFGIEEVIETVEFDSADIWRGQSDLHGALRCERTAL